MLNCGKGQRSSLRRLRALETPALSVSWRNYSNRKGPRALARPRSRGSGVVVDGSVGGGGGDERINTAVQMREWERIMLYDALARVVELCARRADEFWIVLLIGTVGLTREGCFSRLASSLVPQLRLASAWNIQLPLQLRDVLATQCVSYVVTSPTAHRCLNRENKQQRKRLGRLALAVRHRCVYTSRLRAVTT